MLTGINRSRWWVRMNPLRLAGAWWENCNQFEVCVIFFTSLLIIVIAMDARGFFAKPE
jgi:hypothetical protein